MKNQSVSTPVDLNRHPRFSRNDYLYTCGLICLSAGVGMQFGFAIALIVSGVVLITVSVLTSFFVTWLSERK